MTSIGKDGGHYVHRKHGIFCYDETTHPGLLFSCQLDIFKSIYKADGIRGYYQGFFATLLAFTPYSVTHWAGYEATKKLVYNHLAAKEQKEMRLKKNGFYTKYQLSQNNMVIVG